VKVYFEELAQDELDESRCVVHKRRTLYMAVLMEMQNLNIED
jgi:hypothetical protein